MDILDKIKIYSYTNKIALRHRDEKMSYKELHDKSEAFAAFLIENYKDSGRPIVIYGNKENDIIPCMFGALKSGRAYVPIDISFPKTRVKQILKEIEPDVLINFSELEIEHEHKSIQKNDLENIFREYKDIKVEESFYVKDDENCYILFTSGSTGKPKGVQISKNNIENFVSWFKSYCDFSDKEENILNQVSYSFDVSVIPLYIGLASGNTLVSIDKNMQGNYKDLFENLKRYNISLWISTPAFAEVCMADKAFRKELLPELSKFIFAGEVLSKNVVNELQERFGQVTIINGYGPTEATVLVTATKVTEDMIEDEAPIPIGQPIKGGIIKILNENGEEVAEGQKGELVVYSDSVSKGYFKNMELTKKVFIEEHEESFRGYMTGDIVYSKNQMIYYCGRKDFQIKLNGFRIELEDIQSNLNKVSYISNSIVLPVHRDDKISHLVAFVILKEDFGVSKLKMNILIKKELKCLIPDYMIPKSIVALDRFPINNNGKIDRKVLMEEL